MSRRKEPPPIRGSMWGVEADRENNRLIIKAKMFDSKHGMVTGDAHIEIKDENHLRMIIEVGSHLWKKKETK